MLPYGDQHRMGGVQNPGLVSISTFLQMPPWRQMPVIRHGADGELTDLGVGVVARRVGYDAEETFSRAFKRGHGESPSVWRAAYMLR